MAPISFISTRRMLCVGIILFANLATLCFSGETELDTQTISGNEWRSFHSGSLYENQEQMLVGIGYTKGFLHGISYGIYLFNKFDKENIGNVIHKFYPADFNVNKYYDGLNELYSDYANYDLPFLLAYIYINARIKGASEEELKDFLLDFRKMKSK